MDKYVSFERDIWSELGKCMWRNHWRVNQDHLKYIQNDIVKPFRVKFIRYAERVKEKHDLAKYLTPPSMRSVSSDSANWTVCNQEFRVSEIRLTIKDGIPSSMQDELEDHQEDYQSLTHEDWCDLLYTI